MNWLVGAALVLIIALTFNMGLLAYAMYALLSVLLVSRHLTKRWAEGLLASRECNRLSAEVGDKVAVVIDIENQHALPIPWCLIEDVLPREALMHKPPNLKIDGRRLQLVMLRGRGRRSMRYQLECNRRGYYQLGPLVLETGDLFGLHRRYRVATDPHFLLVYPKVIPLEGYDVSSRRPIGEVLMTHRLYEDPTRIAGVRQYAAGDSLNRVHWKATARTGVLHSKVYEPSSVAGATIVMEYHTNSHDKRHEPMRSELAVTAAASIANAVYEMGQQVGLITNGRDAADRIRQEGWKHDARTREAAQRAAVMHTKSDRLRPIVLEPQRGPEQLHRIFETLARVELTDGLTLSQLLTETESRMPRDATVVVILPVVTEEYAIALANLKRNGFAVTVMLSVWDEYDFAQSAGLLLAQGISVHHLKDEENVATVCRKFVLR